MKTTTIKLSREEVLSLLNALESTTRHCMPSSRDEVATWDRLIKRLFRALDRVDG